MLTGCFIDFCNRNTECSEKKKNKRRTYVIFVVNFFIMTGFDKKSRTRKTVDLFKTFGMSEWRLNCVHFTRAFNSFRLD